MERKVSEEGGGERKKFLFGDITLFKRLSPLGVVYSGLILSLQPGSSTQRAEKSNCL